MLSLAAECNKAMSLVLSEKQLFANIYASCQSEADIEAIIRAFIIYLRELECGYLSEISDFVSGAWNLAAALIFDGLIYLNLSGKPIGPAVVELDPFGVVKLSSGDVSVKNTFPISPGALPADMPFWTILS